VRELELLARHLLAVHGLEPVLRRSHLPAALRDARVGSADSRAKPRVDTVQLLAAALRSANGNVREAAREVGISRQLAYRLINTSGLGRADGGVGLGTLAGGEDGRTE
jgi:transcriptional regulator of acetoin/glycerol metabolism